MLYYEWRNQRAGHIIEHKSKKHCVHDFEIEFDFDLNLDNVLTLLASFLIEINS